MKTVLAVLSLLFTGAIVAPLVFWMTSNLYVNTPIPTGQGDGPKLRLSAEPAELLNQLYENVVITSLDEREFTISKVIINNRCTVDGTSFAQLAGVAEQKQKKSECEASAGYKDLSVPDFIVNCVRNLDTFNRAIWDSSHTVSKNGCQKKSEEIETWERMNCIKYIPTIFRIGDKWSTMHARDGWVINGKAVDCVVHVDVYTSLGNASYDFKR